MKGVLNVKKIVDFKQDPSASYLRRFDGANIELSETSMIIHGDSTSLTFPLDRHEEDIMSITYISRLPNNTPFRIVLGRSNGFGESNEPINLSLASLNPDGWSVTFLVSERIKLNLDIVVVQPISQLERLIQGSIMALNYGLVAQFVELSKRTIDFATEFGLSLFLVDNGKTVALKVEEMQHYFDAEDLRKLQRLK